MQQQYYQHNNRDVGDQSFGKNAATAFLSLMIIVTGVGVYLWQGSQAEHGQEDLMARIEKLEGGSDSTGGGEVNSMVNDGGSSTSGVTAYKTSVGNLNLNLSDQYGIVVKVDGQFGDSKRTILHVSKKVASGVYHSVLNNYIEVEVRPANKSTEETLKDAQEALTQSGYTLDKQYESTYQGHEGFLSTGKNTLSQLRMYLFKSGEYAYKFTQYMPLDAENEDNEDLMAVLNGMKIDGVKKQFRLNSSTGSGSTLRSRSMNSTSESLKVQQ